MRPSAPVQGGMSGGKTFMGWWGEMGGPKQKGVVQYTLSPYRQKALSGMLHGYVFAGFSRFMHHVPYFIIPVSIGYATYTWGAQKYAYYNSKEGHHAMAAEHGH